MIEYQLTIYFFPTPHLSINRPRSLMANSFFLFMLTSLSHITYTFFFFGTNSLSHMAYISLISPLYTRSPFRRTFALFTCVQ